MVSTTVEAQGSNEISACTSLVKFKLSALFKFSAHQPDHMMKLKNLIVIV